MKLLEVTPDDRLSAPTPCRDTTVGALLDHLMSLTVAFRNAATKSTPAEQEDGQRPSGPGTASADNLDPDWRIRLPAQLDELVAAWRDPAARASPSSASRRAPRHACGSPR